MNPWTCSPPSSSVHGILFGKITGVGCHFLLQGDLPDPAIDILSYVKQIASPGSMHDTGCLGLVHWDDPEGWDEERGGRGL